MRRTAIVLAAAACVGLGAGAAGAITIDYTAQSDTGGQASYGLSSGGVTVTATGWGGGSNPQAAIDPTNPSASGLTDIQVNIGGSGVLGTRGLGCGVAQCDLVLPGGEDALLFDFGIQVTIANVEAAAIEDPDDVSVWAWSGSAWNAVGGDSCSTFSFCGGNESLGGGYGPLRYLLVVAEDSGASAFRIARFDGVTVVPEPGTLALVGAGLLGVAWRGRRA